MTREPTKVQVVEQLQRILRSDGFQSSPQKRKFLRHIVEKTLEGQAASLKGYAIGVDVFERGDNFDPQLDSIVRSQAGNLRKALDLFYLTTGALDSIRIEVPKGKYVPEFSVIWPGVIEDELTLNADVQERMGKLTRTSKSRAELGYTKIQIKQMFAFFFLAFAILAFVTFSMNTSGMTNTFEDAALLPQGPSLTVFPFENLSDEATYPGNVDIENLRAGLCSGRCCRAQFPAFSW